MDASVTPAALSTAMRKGFGPQIVDVRKRSAFEKTDAMLKGAVWRDCEKIDSWHASLDLGREIVVYCVRGHEVSQTVAAILRSKGYCARYIEGGFEACCMAGLLLSPRPEKPSLWVTRERPKIDRIACPWLIRRFVDPDARFLYVPADRVLDTAHKTGATPYDIPGVAYSHEGELCSFDIFIRRFGLVEPPLLALAKCVRGADTSRLDLDSRAPGLYALSLGLSANVASDHAMLRLGLVIYDALYRWYAELGEETHNWPPKVPA